MRLRLLWGSWIGLGLYLRSALLALSALHLRVVHDHPLQAFFLRGCFPWDWVVRGLLALLVSFGIILIFLFYLFEKLFDFGVVLLALVSLLGVVVHSFDFAFRTRLLALVRLLEDSVCESEASLAVSRVAVQDELALVNCHVILLGVQFAQRNVQADLSVEFLSLRTLFERVVGPDDIYNFVVFLRSRAEVLLLEIEGSLVLHFFGFVPVVLGNRGQTFCGTRGLRRLSRVGLSLRRALRSRSSELAGCHVFGLVELLVVHAAHLVAHHAELGRGDVGEHRVEAFHLVDVSLKLGVVHGFEHFRLVLQHVVVHIAEASCSWKHFISQIV